MTTEYTIQQRPDFNDIDLSFRKNRRTEDVVALRGIDAIATAVENLVNYNYGEIPFQPWIGSNVRRLLFDNINHLTSTFIADGIEQVIANYEPRITLLQVVVTPDPDRNGYNVKIVFEVNNFFVQVTVNMFLERVR